MSEMKEKTIKAPVMDGDTVVSHMMISEEERILVESFREEPKEIKNAIKKLLDI